MTSSSFHLYTTWKDGVAGAMFLLLLLLVPRLSPATILCDGVDDQGATGLPLSVFMTSTTGTMAVWIIATGPPTSELAAYAPGEGQHILGDHQGYVGLTRATQGTDQFWAYLWDGDQRAVGIATTVNVWNHLTWVRTASSLVLYHNGVLVSSVPAAATLDLSYVMKVCFGYHLSLFFQSHVAAIQIWNVALSGNEVETLGKSQLMQPQLTRAPTVYWPLDDCADGASGDGVTFRDRSGNGRDLLMAGGVCQASQHLSYPWGPH